MASAEGTHVLHVLVWHYSDNSEIPALNSIHCDSVYRYRRSRSDCEYKLLNWNTQNNQKACKRHQWKQNRSILESLKCKLTGHAGCFGYTGLTEHWAHWAHWLLVAGAFLLLPSPLIYSFIIIIIFFLKIQFNLFLVLHLKQVQANTDCFP